MNKTQNLKLLGIAPEVIFEERLTTVYPQPGARFDYRGPGGLSAASGWRVGSLLWPLLCVTSFSGFSYLISVCASASLLFELQCFLLSWLGRLEQVSNRMLPLASVSRFSNFFRLLHLCFFVGFEKAVKI